MRVALFLMATLLVGCDRRAAMLEKQYEQAVTTEEECRLAGQIADIYLQKSDEANYEQWSLARDMSCGLARTEKQMGLS